MNDRPDWNPTDASVLRDQPAAYDDMRRRCPVARSEQLGWSLFRHEDVTRVLLDHETFSNQVSRHRSVPNGMDPPEHTAYRRAIEPYFTAEQFTGNPGRFVSLADTVRSFKEITEGKYDHLPEQMFRYKGSIDEVAEAAEKAEFENRQG